MIRTDRPARIIGNESELKHMFLNLLENALESAEDGTTLTVCTRNKGNSVQVIIANAEYAEYYSAAELQAEPLQPPGTASPGIGGMPLSLSICYSIMQHHKGDIRVNSVGEKGLAFILCFSAAVAP